jgi:ketosteroid isomerase-like protein
VGATVRETKIDIAESLAAATAAQDKRAWSRLLAEDVVVQDVQPAPDRPAVQRGREEVWKHMRLAREVFDELHRENDEYVEIGDWLIAIGRWTGTAKGSGAPINQRTVHALRIRDGQVQEWVWSLPDKRSAVDHVQRRLAETRV